MRSLLLLLLLLPAVAAAQTLGPDSTLYSIGVNPDTLHYYGMVPSFQLGGYAGSASSDYCLGTAQFGLSGPNFGLGAGKPVPDPICQHLRIAAALGELSNAYKADGMNDRAVAALDVATWTVCSADIPGLQQACLSRGLVK